MTFPVDSYANLTRTIERQGGDIRAGRLVKITCRFGDFANVVTRSGLVISACPIDALRAADVKKDAA